MPAATATKQEDFVSKEEAKKLKDEATAIFKRLLLVGKLERTSTMEIGWEARKLKEKKLFHVLGFETEDACREKLGVQRATWYRSIQIATGFQKLTKKVFLTMFSGKAWQLLDLPEDERIKPYWIKRASDPQLDEATLVAEIAMKLEKGEIKKDATSKENRGWLKIRMYLLDIEMVEGTLDEFCRKHELGDDRGEALKLMLADSTDSGAGALKVIKQRLPELKATVELLKDASRPAEQRCDAYEKSFSTFITELGKAVAKK